MPIINNVGPLFGWDPLLRKCIPNCALLTKTFTTTRKYRHGPVALQKIDLLNPKPYKPHAAVENMVSREISHSQGWWHRRISRDRIYIYIWVYVYVYIYTHEYMYIYIYMCLYIYIYIEKERLSTIILCGRKPQRNVTLMSAPLRSS